jgi:hypothetical protein
MSWLFQYLLKAIQYRRIQIKYAASQSFAMHGSAVKDLFACIALNFWSWAIQENEEQSEKNPRCLCSCDMGLGAYNVSCHIDGETVNFIELVDVANSLRNFLLPLLNVLQGFFTSSFVDHI